MKNVKTLALAATTIAAMAAPAMAADRGEDIRSGDYSWMQFNAMYAFDELPSAGESGHDYLEMEFGGRAGVVDLYGYVDVFNLTNSSSGDKGDGTGASKMFMKFAPRFSLDAITGMDLSVGPIQEVYFSTLFNWGGGVVGEDVNNGSFGLGADVMVPWLGKTGMNIYAYYDINNSEWNGYQFSMNWFKPVHSFDNGSFVAFQGYVDYQFGADASSWPDDNGVVTEGTSSHGGAAYFGLHWHSDNYALGYGLKGYNDVYLLTDGGATGLETTGWAHYLTATYKL